MTIVQELDNTLFESYIKPKAAVLMGMMRDGVLDPEMDWYETPQPRGLSHSIIILIPSQNRLSARRDPPVCIRNPDVPCGSARTS